MVVYLLLVDRALSPRLRLLWVSPSTITFVVLHADSSIRYYQVNSLEAFGWVKLSAFHTARTFRADQLPARPGRAITIPVPSPARSTCWGTAGPFSSCETSWLA